MRFSRLPEKLRIILIAMLGTAIGWITYEVVYFFIPVDEHKATISWAVSFVIDIFRQHGLHSIFTFNHSFSYWNSLGRAYVYYPLTAIVGMTANFFLTEHFAINHRIAWLLCLIIIALINLFLLKKVVFAPLAEEKYSS
ncbi:MAG: hypothetical protein ACOC41_08250 [Chitinivibrionales bacterium]